MLENERTITDAKTLAAFANPQRARIIDVLRVYGPATASAIADRTDLAVGSVSHHLKVLDQAGIVSLAPELARDRRERWWRLTSRKTRWSRHEFADDPTAVDAALAAENLQAARQFERLQNHRVRESAEDDASFSMQSWLRLTPAELAELGEQLFALIDTWRDREPTSDEPREPVLFFAHGFPSTP